jgi:hypothetical protein
MAQVIVLELPDDASIQEALDAVMRGKPFPAKPYVHAAIRDDADRVLAVFRHDPPTGGDQAEGG